jgi:hypothetical protein
MAAPTPAVLNVARAIKPFASTGIQQRNSASLTVERRAGSSAPLRICLGPGREMRGVGSLAGHGEVCFGLAESLLATPEIATWNTRDDLVCYACRGAQLRRGWMLTRARGW